MDKNIVHSVTIKTEPEIEGKNISLVDFPFICRICLGQSELRLFEEEQCLWDLFVTLTKIEVHSTVDFPRHICKECINKLESISLFIDISKETHSYFGENVKVEDQTCPKPEVNDRSRYCRVCSSSSNLSPFEEKITLLQLFQEITKIDVRANTNVPIENSICSRCSNELQKATDFLNLSMNNNEALRRLANIDTKKEVLLTDGDKSSECLMGINDVKDECTHKDSVTGIKVEMLFDDSKNRSSENFEETSEYKSLHTSIDMKEELLEHMAHSDPSNLESCTRFRIESKSSEDIQEQIKSGTETSQLKSSKDKELQPIELTLFKYDYCRRRLTQKSESQTHTTEKPFKCDYCDKYFTSNFYVKKHMLTHTEDKPFKCDHCDKHFILNSNLKRHLVTHTGETPFKCDYCDRHFNLNCNLKRHLLTHTGETSMKCHYCCKGFTHKSYLNTHLLTHTGEKPFKCDHCDRHFNLNCNLKRHLLTHTGEKPFKCCHCDKAFALKQNLNSHLLTHNHSLTQTREKPFKCDHCDKYFTSKSDVKKHLLTHTEETPLKCHYCCKGFTHKSYLNTHLLTHTGEKPFKCDHCDKHFNLNRNLKRHLLTHTGEKPFKCFHCGKAFALKQNLNSHILTHNHSLTQTREKPFKCDHCDKYFTSKSDVKKHLLTHTVDKPFKCN